MFWNQVEKGKKKKYKKRELDKEKEREVLESSRKRKRSRKKRGGVMEVGGVCVCGGEKKREKRKKEIYG